VVYLPLKQPSVAIFICKESPLLANCLLKPRADWRSYVKAMYDPIQSFLPNQLDLSSKHSIKILSLNDGISTSK